MLCAVVNLSERHYVEHTLFLICIEWAFVDNKWLVSNWNCIVRDSGTAAPGLASC